MNESHWSRYLLLSLLLVSLRLSSSLPSKYNVSDYDVEWDVPSSLETESMPLGNGDLTLNIWVNQTDGSLQYYAQIASAWEENGQILKLIRGRVDLGFASIIPPSPPVFTDFQHHLHIHNASQTISFSSGSLQVWAMIWVDRFNPVAHFTVQTSRPILVQNAIEMWRTIKTPMGSNWGSYYCDQRYVYPDQLLTSDWGSRSGEVGWYHRNDGDLGNTMYDASLKQQNLTGVGLEQLNPLINRTFGGYIVHDDANKWSSANVVKTSYGLTAVLRRQSPTNLLTFSLFAHTVERSSQSAWVKDFSSLVKQIQSIPADKRVRDHLRFWSDFYNRSHIEFSISNDPKNTYLINQAQLLQRMCDAMNGYSQYPIHFNGQGWNIGQYSDSPQGPDYRQWGSAFWWQNVREPYYPAVQAGDFDLLLPMFHFYQHNQRVQEARVRTYYNHGGAYWDETTTMYGIVVDGGFGYQCDGTLQLHNNPWIRYHWDGSFELCLLMIQYYTFTQDENFAKVTLIPVCSAVMEFFEQHFHQRDANNQTIFYPSQSLETWQCDPFYPDRCPVNAIIYVSGMVSTLTSLISLDLPSSIVPPSQRDNWIDQLSHLPPLPRGQCYTNTSLTCLLPAQSGWHPGVVNNSENVELYTVWPYNLYGLGKPDFSTILNNYNLRPFPCNDGWCQDIVNAALLGLRDDTAKMMIERANLAPATGWKFPTFVGPLQDSTPAVDHFSILRTAATAIIIQETNSASFNIEALMSQRPHEPFVLLGEEMGSKQDDEVQNRTTLLMFAGLPDGWDVDFKLWASGHTIVEGRCVNNTLVSLQVTPSTRLNDIVLLGCTTRPGSIFDTSKHHAEREVHHVKQRESLEWA